MFKDKLTFLGLDYRDAWLLTVYFVDLGISIPKIGLIGWFNHIKICCTDRRTKTDGT